MPSQRHPWKQAARDTRAHKVIEEYLGAHGADSEVEMTVPMPDHASANEGRLSINRGARHYGTSASARVTDAGGQHCTFDCADPQAPHAVAFTLWSKDRARAHVFRESGGDPAALRFNPWAKRQ